MHELALAQSIIEIGENEARKHGDARILKIKLLLGELTGVVREALEFSFEAARFGTSAERATLEIELVPLRARCLKCGPVLEPQRDFCLLCPGCGDAVVIVSGREMQVEYVDLDSELREDAACSVLT